MKTYLFDFDGTLVDSMPTFSKVMLSILDGHGVVYGSDIIKTITPLGLTGTAKYFIELGIGCSMEEIIAEMGGKLMYEYMYNIPAKQHVEHVLRKLKARGDDLNILTASPHATLDPCLKRLGLYELFTNVWSCDDFGTTKADPEIYVMAARRMSRPVDEVLFLDDNYNADRTAASAGMKVCGVYDDSSAEYEDAIRSVADFYIRDFSELPDLW